MTDETLTEETQKTFINRLHAALGPALVSATAVIAFGWICWLTHTALNSINAAQAKEIVETNSIDADKAREIVKTDAPYNRDEKAIQAQLSQLKEIYEITRRQDKETREAFKSVIERNTAAIQQIEKTNNLILLKLESKKNQN